MQLNEKKLHDICKATKTEWDWNMGKCEKFLKHMKNIVNKVEKDAKNGKVTKEAVYKQVQKESGKMINKMLRAAVAMLANGKKGKQIKAKEIIQILKSIPK